jgi:hypothetical protein
LGAAAQRISELFLDVNSAETEIKSMQEHCYRIDEHKIGTAIADRLQERIKLPILKLDNIEVDLRKPGANFQQQWQTFSTTTSTVSQTILTEYIEFLGGFALRDTGFDAGISQVADELLRSYSKRTDLHMMAIPTRQQAVAMTLAQIVRVTFPDWTIWSLPSTAHEFWHIVAWKDLEDELHSALRQLPGNKSGSVEPRFNNCLGDAFAAYTMGPAYAFFAIFLLLDPLSPYTSSADDAAHEVRAHSIFQMLECMDLKGSIIDRPYSDVRERLRAAWDNAISQTGAKPKIDEKKQLNEEKQVADDKRRTTDLVKALYTTLIKTSASPAFTVEIWNEIKDKWVDPLIQGKVDEIKVPVDAELRHVLNAAWLARVHPERDPNHDITPAVKKLAERVTDPDRK